MSHQQRARVGSIGVSAVAVGLVLAMGLSMTPAFACTVLANIQTKPGRGVPGDVIRVEGSGFELHGSPISIYWGGRARGALLTNVATSDGRFSVDVTVPANAVSHSEYLIEAVQASSPPIAGVTVFRVPAQPTVVRSAPAPVAPAPAHAAVAAPAASPGPQAATAAQPAPVQQPVAAPADASGFSQAGSPAFASGGQPVAPISQPVGTFGGAAGHSPGGQSPWVLLPLGLLGLGLFSAGAAATVRQVKREGTKAAI